MRYFSEECHYKEAWMPITAYSIIKWLRENNDENRIYTSSQRVEEALDEIQNYLFNECYKSLSVKPIGKCSIEELEEELRKRRGESV